MNRPYRRTTEYQIQDPAMLRRVMADLIARIGSEPRLAKASGISQPHLNKLRNAKLQGVGPKVLSRLLRVATPTERAQLDRAFTSPQAQARYRRYIAWLLRELRGYGLHLEDSALTGTASGLADARAPQVRRGKPRLEGSLGDLLSVVRQRNTGIFRAAMEPTERQWAGAPDGRWRMALAFLRVAAPLWAAVETGGVERSFQELQQAGELKSYLRHALAAQVILLRRETTLARARQS